MCSLVRMSEFKHESAKYGIIDLNTLVGVQSALQVLGFDPGVADGIDGPKTKAAVKAFQESGSIAVDGIVGPTTAGWLNAQNAPIFQEITPTSAFTVTPSEEAKEIDSSTGAPRRNLDFS